MGRVSPPTSSVGVSSLAGVVGMLGVLGEPDVSLSEYPPTSLILKRLVVTSAD